MNLNVVELTGDTDNVDFSTLSNADLILATPEKLGKTHRPASHTFKKLPLNERDPQLRNMNLCMQTPLQGAKLTKAGHAS